jgi:hypothetical protein
MVTLHVLLADPGTIAHTACRAHRLYQAVHAAHAQYYGTGSNRQTHTSSGYTTSRGTYVQPYVATNANGTHRDNFSARQREPGKHSSFAGVRGP